MSMRKGPATLATVVILILTVSAFAAGQDQKDQKGRRNQQPQPPQPQVQANIGPLPQSKDELDAFLAAQNEQMPAKKIELSEAFITKFPNSDFVSYAQMYRVGGYGALGKPNEMVGAAEQGIDSTIKLGEKIAAKADADGKLGEKERDALRKKDKNAVFFDKSNPQFAAFMNQSELRILALYQTIIQGYQQLNDAAKMVEWGNKALGVKPDDVNTLSVVANVMAERPPSNEEEKTKQMKRAEELVDQALALLPSYLSGPDAANLQPQGKADLTSQLHYTLGLIYLQQKKLGSSQQELLTAIKSKPNDPITYYRLGIAYVQDMKNDQAMEALGKSVFLKGVAEQSAKDILKQLYVQKNKSEQGLDDYIQKVGKQIGQ
jgi:tetratricopeptide (TPR) repeat protein